MKLFMAGLDTETNTFSPIPTGRESFEENLLAHGDATRRPLNYCSSQLAVWRRRAEAQDFAIVESLCAVAEPAGPTSRGLYESFRDEILRDLRTAGAVDIVLLALHGAMVAEGYDDVEGDLISHVRAQVGLRVPIGIELDLHCHLTERMRREATAMVLYKEYPHTDIEARAEEIFDIILDAAEGRTRPTMAMFDCCMVGTFRTQEEPLRTFVDRVIALEGQNRILSISLAHGFPWGDVSEAGVKVLVVADGDEALAQELASALGYEIYGMRRALQPRCFSIDAALDLAVAASHGPVVLADVSDNAGGGAPGDSTFILQSLLQRGVRNAACGLYWDPIAVQFCRAAGEGATLDLRIGGKAGTASGQPVDLRVVVRRIATGLTQPFGQVSLSLGDTVWVSGHGIELVLSTRRTQVFHPVCFESLGIDLARMHIVVVKSTNHFYAGFAPIAREVLFVDGPGALRQCFADLPYRKLVRPYWPRVENPLSFNGSPPP